MTNGKTPKVSVVCAWYNRADFLRDTLDSLLAQDLDDYDITFVNDGSPDPRVREILDTYDHPRLTILHQQNTGFIGAIRKAIDHSGGEYIAIMGAGDVALPSRLQKQAGMLDGDPDYIGVGCNVRQTRVDPEGRVTELPNYAAPASDFTHADLLRSMHSPFSHGEVMYRRSAYEAVGGYRPTFRFAQDFDLWLRMSQDGGKYGIHPDILYERRHFEADGIASDLNKSMVQLSLAAMALDCARTRDERGYDLIDVFGPQAGMFRRREASLAKHFAKAAIKYLKAGHPKEAHLFADLAWREKIVPLSLLARLVVTLDGLPRFHWLAQKMAAAVRIRDQRLTLPIRAVSGTA